MTQAEPSMFIPKIDDRRERERERNPDARPPERFAHGDDMGSSMEHAEVEREENENEGEKCDPDDHHGPPSRGSLAGRTALDRIPPGANAP
jgi:hypothetical protein